MLLLKVLFACLFVLLIGKESHGRSPLQKKDFLAAIKAKFIYPGTKWCGAGDTAKSYDDLGYNREADKCCREHDKHCSLRLNPMQSTNGLRNWSLRIASHCDCEVAFKKCLDKVNDAASKGLFLLYFKKIHPRCIRLKTVTENKCIKRTWYLKCIKHQKIQTQQAYFVDLNEAVEI